MQRILIGLWKWSPGLDLTIKLKAMLTEVRATQAPVTREMTREILKVYRQGYQANFLSSRYGHAFFTSPNPGIANYWKGFVSRSYHTKGRVLHYEIKISDLQLLAAQNKIYVGFEKGQVEIAFYDPQSIDLLIASYRDSSP